MQNILNRDIIAPDIAWMFGSDIFDEPWFNRNINRIKHLMLDRGVQKGDTIVISILGVDPLHVASLIACAELGCKLFLLDTPATEESLPYTKIALHGGADWYIETGKVAHIAYEGLHGKLLHEYCGIPIDIKPMVENVPEGYDLPIQPWTVDPEDTLLISSTSGTTRPSRPVLFSHKEVMGISQRNIPIFKFDKDSRVCHSRNLHHASALLTSLLPSLMMSRVHFTFPISHHHPVPMEGYITDRRKDFETIQSQNMTHIMIPNRTALNDFLDFFEEPFNTKLNINMCGFAMTPAFRDMAEKYNVCFDSHYGSIDTAIPLLVNRVDKDTDVLPNCLGEVPDDFYKVRYTKNTLRVSHPWWDEPREMEDNIYRLHTNNKVLYLLGGRKKANASAWDLLVKHDLEDLDLSVFGHDTKVSMEQLRGHIATVKGIPYEDV